MYPAHVGARQQTVLVLDWPNLLVGAAIGGVLGAGVTATFWAIDHRGSRKTRMADVRADWAVAAKRLEILSMTPGTGSADFYLARVEYPIDRWRGILGADDFRKLDRLESAFGAAEHWSRQLAVLPNDPDAPMRAQRAIEELSAAVNEFANMSRAMQSTGYTDVTDREARAELRREYVRHPFRTLKRERQNKRVRRAAGL